MSIAIYICLALIAGCSLDIAMSLSKIAKILQRKENKEDDARGVEVNAK